jgi:lipoprotein-anchoring transpeptidase ErfK/SrfK
MIARQPYLARFTAGGEGNPLGARAIYLGNTMYRIHGTNDPQTIGTPERAVALNASSANIY